jgi:PKHD-type hydroxylase
MPFCFVANNIFSPEECRSIIQLGREAPATEAMVKTKAGTSYKQGLRQCDLAWFSQEEQDYQWFHQRIADTLVKVNQDIWQFELDGKKEYAQFTSYGPGHKFDWHTDVGAADISRRKLTCVIHLNDASEYQGGELLLFATSTPRKVSHEVGSMIIFPSYVLHRVMPVTAGRRYTLVQWMSGSSAYR